MSKNIIQFAHYFFIDSNIKTNFSFTQGLLILTPLFAYTILTYNSNKIINVTNKYKMNTFGFTHFMLVTDKNEHYSFYSVEKWHLIQLNNKYKINSFGYRIPILGLFPNIVTITPVKSNPFIKSNDSIDIIIKSNDFIDILYRYY
jgi:hypothetical protein